VASQRRERNIDVFGLGHGALGSRLGRAQAREAGTEKSGVSGISLSRAADSIAYALLRVSGNASASKPNEPSGMVRAIASNASTVMAILTMAEPGRASPRSWMRHCHGSSVKRCWRRRGGRRREADAVRLGGRSVRTPPPPLGEGWL
jgi:hypothetical protein